MKEKLDEIVKYIESKINLEFDFDVEYWNNGNFDDSYYYGVEVGEEYAYRDMLVQLKKLQSKL